MAVGWCACDDVLVAVDGVSLRCDVDVLADVFVADVFMFGVGVGLATVVVF